MQRIRPRLFLAAAILPLAAAVARAQSWEGIGGSETAGGIGAPAGVTHATLASDSAGRPVVAWTDFQVRLRRWNGTTWEELGGSATGGAISNHGSGSVTEASLALDAAGNPVVAWVTWDGVFNFQIYVKKWDGLAWTELAGSATGGGITGYGPLAVYYGFWPSLALDGAGNPTVAWSAEASAGNQEIYVKRWTGAAWVGLGGSETGGGISSTPLTSTGVSLRLDPAGLPVAMWVENVEAGYHRQIYLKRWTGTAWVGVGGSATGLGISGSTADATYGSMALDATGKPAVSWSDSRREFMFPDIYFRRWNGTDWVGLGGSDEGFGLSSGSASGLTRTIIDDAGRPVVAWQEDSAALVGDDIRVKRWSGTEWVALGGGAINPGSSGLRPSLARGDAGNPVVAWFELGGVYLRQYVEPAPVSPTPTPSPSTPPAGDAASGGHGGRCAAADGGALPLALLALAAAGVIKRPRAAASPDLA